MNKSSLITFFIFFAINFFLFLILLPNAYGYDEGTRVNELAKNYYILVGYITFSGRFICRITHNFFLFEILKLPLSFAINSLILTSIIKYMLKLTKLINDKLKIKCR